jgi:hypothetical protein
MASPVTATIPSYTGGGATGWRAWCQAVSQALDNAGLARVNDTGAITSPAGWLSVAFPGTNGSFGGFEIRKLADPSPGASPVYMRFSYGVYTANSVGMRLQLQVGTGTDGAGNITFGSFAVPAGVDIVNGYDNAGGSATKSLYVTYDGDGLVIAHAWDLFAQTGVANTLTVVERQRSPSGAAVPNAGWPNTGFMRLVTSVTHSVTFYDPVSGDCPTTTRFPAISGRVLTSSTSMVSADGETTMWPIFNVNRQGAYGSKMILGVAQLDAPLGLDMAVTHLGAVRTYRSMGSMRIGCDQAASAGASCAIWWHD